MFAIPDDFVRTQIEVHGAEGRAWLDRLPALLDACAQQWGLTLGPPFPHLSYHYAAPAVRADGTPVVVKACAPTGEFLLESKALRVYDGRGATRLLVADREREVMLLERLEPGTLLLSVEDDAEATTIAAGVMRALWRPVPAEHPFPSVADWGQGFARLRRRYGGGTGPFPPGLVAQAERLFAELSASAAAPVVLHGDLHHYNILATGQRGRSGERPGACQHSGERPGVCQHNVLATGQREWLAIDPKGLIGEPAYEIGAFLRNRLPEPLPNAEAGRLTARRMEQFAAELGFERARVRGWALAQAVLSAWWSVEDHGHGWEPMIALAELIAALKE